MRAVVGVLRFGLVTSPVYEPLTFICHLFVVCVRLLPARRDVERHIKVSQGNGREAGWSVQQELGGSCGAARALGAMALCGPLWPSMALYGPFWPSLALSGPRALWPSVALCGPRLVTSHAFEQGIVLTFTH